MTVKELYEKTKKWMFEKTTSKVFDDYCIEVCNKVLADIYDLNNKCRMFYGHKPLTKIPQVTSMSDELGVIETETSLDETQDGLGIMPEFQLYVVPLGMDANFLMDDDLSKKSIYDSEYYNAKVMHQKIVSKAKMDELGGN